MILSPVGLRQDEVAEFIRSRKGEKYSGLLPLFGLHDLEVAIENLRQLVRAIERKSALDGVVLAPICCFASSAVRDPHTICSKSFGKGVTPAAPPWRRSFHEPWNWRIRTGQARAR